MFKFSLLIDAYEVPIFSHKNTDKPWLKLQLSVRELLANPLLTEVDRNREPLLNLKSASSPHSKYGYNYLKRLLLNIIYIDFVLVDKIK
jgi:hypothetical protein